MIAYSDSKRIKYMRSDAGEVSKFWRFSYGVEDLPASLASLADRGFLELAEDGVTYIPTDIGRKEEKANGYVHYLHKSSHIELTPWQFNQIIETVPERIKSYSWKDKLWWWFNQQSLHGRSRSIAFAMAKFRADEGSYSDAIQFLDEVMAMDRNDSQPFIAPGLVKLRDRWLKKLN